MVPEKINPWLQIWVNPKKMIRAMIDRNPTRVIIWLAILWGILSGLSSTSYLMLTYPHNALYRNVFFVITVLIAGGFFGIIYLYIGGWLFKLTGAWVGGKGTFTSVKCAIGWSYYPFIIAHVIGYFSVLSIPNIWLQSLFGLINVVITVWGMIIFLNVVGEAHRFSAWKALLAWMIALVLVLVVIMLISLLIPLLAPIFY